MFHYATVFCRVLIRKLDGYVYDLFQTVLTPHTLTLITHVSLTGLETAFVAFLPLHRANQVSLLHATRVQTAASGNLFDFIHIHGFTLHSLTIDSLRHEIQPMVNFMNSARLPNVNII